MTVNFHRTTILGGIFRVKILGLAHAIHSADLKLFMRKFRNDSGFSICFFFLLIIELFLLKSEVLNGKVVNG